jgi:hypothetical protein
MKKKDIFIDYENICLNCKEKGFYFGFSFKTVEYKGKPILDIPARYLNGPASSCSFRGWPLVLFSMMNSHQPGALPTEPVFAMMNSKYGDTLTKFTYQYLIQNNKALRMDENELVLPNPKIIFYVDTYHYPNKPYILMYFAFRNLTGFIINNFKFYQFYDFDIYGQDSHGQDSVNYREDLDVIYQFNSPEGPEKSLIAGITSSPNQPSSHFEGNKALDILINVNKLDLSDCYQVGPDDCAVAMQWNFGDLKPNEVAIFPVAMVMGFGEENFFQNCCQAREQLEKFRSQFEKSINEPSRQEMDPKLQQMSFSVTEWCKEAH